MSAPLVSGAIADEIDPLLTSRQRSPLRAVLVVLAEHANREAIAWPSVARIAREAAMGESTVRRALNALEAAGRITAIAGRRGGRGGTTRWRVTPKPSHWRAGFRQEKAPTNVRVPGDESVAGNPPTNAPKWHPRRAPNQEQNQEHQHPSLAVPVDHSSGADASRTAREGGARPKGRPRRPSDIVAGLAEGRRS